MRLARRDEGADDAVDHIGSREEVDENARQQMADELSLEGTRSANAVEQNGHLFHGLKKKIRYVAGWLFDTSLTLINFSGSSIPPAGVWVIVDPVELYIPANKS